jgi:hypothetical protein
MSSPSFLLANETNHTLLSALVGFINLILEYQFTSMYHTCSLVLLKLNQGIRKSFLDLRHSQEQKTF